MSSFKIPLLGGKSSKKKLWQSNVIHYTGNRWWSSHIRLNNMTKDSLLYDDKVGCFPSWHKVQSNGINETGPNKLLNTKSFIQGRPRHECQSLREDWDVELEAAKTIGMLEDAKKRAQRTVQLHGLSYMSRPRILHITTIGGKDYTKPSLHSWSTE